MIMDKKDEFEKMIECLKKSRKGEKCKDEEK